jgi:hypothetical protein
MVRWNRYVADGGWSRRMDMVGNATEQGKMTRPSGVTLAYMARYKRNALHATRSTDSMSSTSGCFREYTTMTALFLNAVMVSPSA